MDKQKSTMDTEQLNKALYEKMSAEQERYKHNLLGQTPESILNHAYEYAMREDILMEVETIGLPARQAKVLLESPFPLVDIYKDFRDMETDHMECVRECIEQRADDLLEAQYKKTRAIPLYRESLSYAEAHGEAEQWRASHEANIACRDAIETAIRDSHDGTYHKPGARGVLSEFGLERMSHVLAATLLDRTGDQWISKDNQVWAVKVPMFENGSRADYALSSHSIPLDGFVKSARQEMAIMRKVQELTGEKTAPAQKPSIREQLAAAKAAQTEKPAAQQHLQDQAAR